MDGHDAMSIGRTESLDSAIYSWKARQRLGCKSYIKLIVLRSILSAEDSPDVIMSSPSEVKQRLTAQLQVQPSNTESPHTYASAQYDGE